MARGFVVEHEARCVDIASHRHQATRLRQPARRAGCDRGEGPSGAINRRQGVKRQQVLDVGEDQLLVLLLMVQAELDQHCQLCRPCVV